MGLDCLGIDLSKNNIQTGSSKFPDIGFAVADAENLPFRPIFSMLLSSAAYFIISPRWMMR